MPVVENDNKPSRVQRDSLEPVEPAFELGEDVSQRNEAREKAWVGAATEGREQLSARETMIKYGTSLQQAIRIYEYVKNDLLWILEQKLTLGLAREVVDYLYYDSGRLITFCNMIRNRDAAHFDEVVRGSDTAFQVCVRVRPLFEHEQADGEYKTVLCAPLQRRQISVHEGSLDRSGRRMEMIHHNLMFHKIWNESVPNEDVGADILDPLVQFVENGKAATVVMYGQTGTGKTYTFQGLLMRLCTLLQGREAEVTFIEIDGRKSFDLLKNRNPVKLLSDADDNVHVKGAATPRLKISLPSKTELDKLIQQAQQAEAALSATVEHELPNGEGSDVPSVPITAKTDGADAGDFFSAVMLALAARSQLVTERNPVSSRTHAVCQIRIVPENETQDPGSAKGKTTAVSGGPHVLTLVDLAGSERKYETMHMSVQEHKRSADINYTLMTLRHVFRTFNANLARAEAERLKASGQSAEGISSDGFPSLDRAGPAEMRRLTAKKMTKARAELRRQADHFVLASHFRGSLLTRILRSSFTGTADTHRTKVIATVSPAATDVYHTLNTLEQVVLMSPFLEQMTMQMEVEVLLSNTLNLTKLPVKEWGPAEVGIWLRTAEHGRFADVALPPSITGAQLLQLSQASLAELFGQQGRIARTRGEGESWVITNVDGTRRDHYSKGPRDWGGAIYRSLMTFQKQFEQKKLQKLASKEEEGEQTQGGASKT